VSGASMVVYVLAGVGAGALLALAIEIARRRLIAWQLRRLMSARRMRTGIRTRRVVAGERVADALAERRQRIRAAEREFGGLARIPYEFVEMPGWFDGLPARRDLPESERLIHAARLAAELRDDRFSLAQRVIDGVRVLKLRELLSTDELPTLMYFERRAANAYEYPWQLSIEVPHLHESLGLLLDEWFAVPIEFFVARPPRPLHAGQCMYRESANQRRGRLGGLLAIDGDLWGATCRHVIADQCHCRHPSFDASSVDLALIRPDGCFSCRPPPRRELGLAGPGEIEEFARAELPVRKSYGSMSRPGCIVGPIPYIRVEDRFYRGSFLMIRPSFVRWLGVTWPIFERQFSIPGDSGGWVVDQAGRWWIGMVIAGDEPPNRYSYLLAAHFLHEIVEVQLGGIRSIYACEE
jgi:hypothetical protein